MSCASGGSIPHQGRFAVASGAGLFSFMPEGRNLMTLTSG